MNLEREDIFIYCAMIAAAGTLFSGVLYDMGAIGTALASAIIAAGAVVVAFFNYLAPAKGSKS